MSVSSYSPRLPTTRVSIRQEMDFTSTGVQGILFPRLSAFSRGKSKEVRRWRLPAKATGHACRRVGQLPRSKGEIAAVVAGRYCNNPTRRAHLTSGYTPKNGLVAWEVLSIRCQATSHSSLTVLKWRPTRTTRCGIRNDDTTRVGPF